MQRKFLNIIADGDTATVLLYGPIGRWKDEVSDADLVRELKEAEGSYKKIEVRINSEGGEVYAGIAIFNVLRESKADVRILVDGIAASMASVIALCGKPVEMSKYARLMLHSVSGGCWGTKDDMRQTIDELERLETTLAEMYGKKTGKSADEIKAAYFDGKDHWLSASEALALGFIDGIYDADPVSDGATPQEIYNIFNNRLQSHKTQNDMNIEDLRNRPRFKDCATDADVMRVIAQLEGEAGKVTGLATELETTKAELKVFQDNAKAQAEASKKALLDEAEKDGRINAQTRPTYQALLDADLENGTAALNNLSKKRMVMDDLKNPDGTPVSAWDKRQKEIHDRNQSKIN
jgi:ATP-dependent Clp endopeptidase proteolytic subunit ClpP